MLKSFRNLALAASAACLSMPAIAQGETEEARTTYQVTMLKLGPDAQNRWGEIMDETVAPARAAAGLPPTQIHWLMAGPWHIMLITEMPEGLASLDRHVSASGAAYQAALEARLGSEAAVEALNKEMDGLVVESQRTFSHTHP